MMTKKKLISYPTLGLPELQDPTIFIYYKDQGDNGDAVATKLMVDSILDRYPSARFDIAVVDGNYDAHLGIKSPFLKVREVLPKETYPLVNLVYSKGSGGGVHADRSKNYLLSENKYKSSASIVSDLSQSADLKVVVSTTPQRVHYESLGDSVWVMEYGVSRLSNLERKVEAATAVSHNKPTVLSTGFGPDMSFYQRERPTVVLPELRELCLADGPVYRMYQHEDLDKKKSLFVAANMLLAQKTVTETTVFVGAARKSTFYPMTDSHTGDHRWDELLLESDFFDETDDVELYLNDSFVEWAKSKHIAVELMFVNDDGTESKSHIYGDTESPNRRHLRVVAGRLDESVYESLRAISSQVTFIDGDNGLAEAVSFEEVPIFGNNKMLLLSQLMKQAKDHDKKDLLAFFNMQKQFYLSCYMKTTCFKGEIINHKRFHKFLKNIAKAITPQIQSEWKELCAVFKQSPSIGDQVCEILAARLASSEA